MRVGICGFPGSGKTTVFSALAPGATAKGGVTFGSIKVPDDRVDRLAVIFNPKKTTYAEITFVDVGGAARKGALSPDVVQNMRNADVLVHVVRVFDNPMLAEAAPDPARDVSAFHDELLLLDLGILEKRAERFAKEGKKGMEVDVTKKCVDHLNSGQAIRSLHLAAEEMATLGGIQLLSLKPLITLYNLSEPAWEDPGNAALKATKETGVDEVSMAMCGALEGEIAKMSPADQQEMLEGLGLGEPARNPFIRTAYRLLDLISFLTSGEDECRAWPVRRGTGARRASGKVHSDIERGFIRAEVYRVDELEGAGGSEAQLKKLGKIRVEGADNVVQDGDVMHFRFNV